MLIDAHTHLYPVEFSKNPAAWAERVKEHHWGKLMTARAGKPSLQSFVSPELMLEAMDASRIDQSVLLGWYWETPDVCSLHNHFMAKLLASYRERFRATVALHPGMTRLRDILKKAYDDGFCGVGELFPELQGFKIDEEPFQTIATFCAEHHWPITIHVTEPIGREHPGAFRTPLQSYLSLAQKFPEVKWVFAHWGGLLPFYELNPFVKNSFKNVYYDTAASPLLYESRIWRSVVDAVGAEKIIFGSDYPLRIYPAITEPTVTPLIDEVTGTLLPEEADLILGGNAELLWGKQA